MSKKFVTVHVKLPTTHSKILDSYVRHSAPGTTRSDLIRRGVAKFIFGKWKKDQSGYLVPA